ARQAPGVVLVMTHENVPATKPPPTFSASSPGDGVAGSKLPVMQSGEIWWNGQPVAAVVAETQEQADHAAMLVQVEYRAAKAALDFDALKGTAKAPESIFGEPAEVSIGNAEATLAGAAFKTDHLYRTPRYNQNAIELHGTLAAWSEDEGKLVVYDATQSITWLQKTLATTFGIDAKQVRVLAPFVGGGFGGKGLMWNHTVLCVAAAKLAGRPVKLVLSREGVYRITGGRTLSEQRVALGADVGGVLQSLVHSGTTGVVSHNDFPEQFSFPPRHLYASPNIWISQKGVDLNMVANAPMRAPGESIGTFALESAIDELAVATGIDPIELRRRNEPAKDPVSQAPFSMRHIVEAYRRGAEKFGWAKRNAKPRSQRDGDWWVGQGVATALYPYFMMQASASIRVSIDGSAEICVAAHEMGMGTATVQVQHAADRLGLPMGRISFRYGDSDLPKNSTAGGSSQTATVVAAVTAAANELHTVLLKLVDKASPLAGARLDEIEARDNGLFLKGEGKGRGETYEAILRHARRDQLEASGDAPMPREMLKYSIHSYGAQFCEVRVNAVTGEVRIAHWLGSFDVGRVLNPKTAYSQLRGGIIMGIGMALSEETLFDERNGRIMNPSLVEYHVPVHLDVPRIDILCNDIPDPHTPLGLHGIGEIGITGAAAAIANAVYNATGIRVRELPITLDKLLGS
ncbi:MAG: xanthine dehydrogenase family protein molybdopterin-binding subunit, partial [Caldimonas sp.]